MSYKKQELLTFRPFVSTWIHPRLLVGVRVTHIFSFYVVFLDRVPIAACVSGFSLLKLPFLFSLTFIFTFSVSNTHSIIDVIAAVNVV